MHRAVVLQIAQGNKEKGLIVTGCLAAEASKGLRGLGQGGSKWRGA
jgi:hypothetical protein